MQTLTTPAFAETIIKRSKFLSYLVPIDRFDSIYERLKSEHPKANHIVYASRSFNEHRQIVENSSDDGEPKGCAGAPTLNVLRGAELVECGLLTVRYFGGIKLGTGGMVRAYTKAAHRVIDLADLLRWIHRKTYRLRCPYTRFSELEYRLEKLDVEILSKGFKPESVCLQISVEDELFAMLKKEFEEFLYLENTLVKDGNGVL
jgi:uncharacterized YigZ family protein